MVIDWTKDLPKGCGKFPEGDGWEVAYVYYPSSGRWERKDGGVIVAKYPCGDTRANALNLCEDCASLWGIVW